MNKELKTMNESLHLDQNYTQFLSGIKERLQTAQIRAALAANSELIQFYWELGNDLIEKQKNHQWGSGFLEQFSHDMRQAFPEMQGFSVRNLQRIKQFSQLYPDLVITPQAVAQLPWGHISLLIHAVKDKTVREWYAQQTIKNGWSRSVLEMQIEGGLYERQADTSKKITNFHKHLPALQSDLANEILKDPYNFDFLTIQGEAHERAVEDALVTHIRDFLLELGQGFSFVGSQVPLTFDDQEFFVDLLFYHLHLRAFVVIELKATKFKPEHTGQLGFYLAAVDDLLRKEGDNQTIGILLCKSKHKVIAEYALRNVSAPIGVSEYTLSKAIPKELKTNLPSVEELEAELSETLSTNTDSELSYVTSINLSEAILKAREGLVGPEADWATIGVIYPYAHALSRVLSEEKNLKKAIEHIQSNPLISWLNNKDHNFYHAKKKMIKKGLTAPNDFQPSTRAELQNKYFLEFTCANIIRFLMNDEKKLQQIPALKGDHKKIQTAMIYIKTQLDKLGTTPFENEIWQNLFQLSLEKLLKNDARSIYSAGKFHEKLASELMSKKMMQSMCLMFGSTNLAAGFIIDIAIIVTAHFFTTTIDLKQAKTYFPKIKANVEETLSLQHKTVEALLKEYASARQIDY